MRNLFLMSLFGLCMMAAYSGQSLADFTFTAPAYADEADDQASNDDQNTDDQANNDDQSTGDESGNDDQTTNDQSDNEDQNSDDQASNDDAFHCPEGITTCYKADGTPYQDINNLPASAAGAGGIGGGSSVVKPTHFRSF